jgi:hypothetical protein
LNAARIVSCVLTTVPMLSPGILSLVSINAIVLIRVCSFAGPGQTSLRVQRPASLLSLPTINRPRIQDSILGMRMEREILFIVPLTTLEL